MLGSVVPLPGGVVGYHGFGVGYLLGGGCREEG